MDDNRHPRDEKGTLGQTAKALRQSTDLSQEQLANELGVDRRRISEIESGAATAELLQEIAARLGYRAVHVIKTIDHFEFLNEGRRRPVDPIGLTPEQEVVLYEACRALCAKFEAMYRGRIRRENLACILETAKGQWKQLKRLAPSRRQAEIRRDCDLHTWGFCLLLCNESVCQATDDPKAAIHVGQLAIVTARCCADLPWADRLMAYALAHLANTYRVLGKHLEADRLFAQANRLWNSLSAVAADPGVLDPGRIHHLEAALRKDQRKLPEALALLEQAFPISRVPGRILVSRSLVLSLMDSYEEAIATLRRADTLLEDREPRDELLLNINTGVNLCHLKRFEEAAVFADAALRIAEASRNWIDILRSRWLQARVLAGQGDRLLALSIYRNLLDEFTELNMEYDLALVTLEFGDLLLSLGRTRECQSLTAGLPEYFEAKGIHQEASAARKVRPR